MQQKPQRSTQQTRDVLNNLNHKVFKRCHVMFFSTATTAQSLVLQKFACFLPSSIFAACLPRDLFVTFVFFRHEDSETCRFFIPVNLASLVEDCGIARLHLCRPGRHRLSMCLCRSDSFQLLRLLDPSSCLSCRSDSFRQLRLLAPSSCLSCRSDLFGQFRLVDPSSCLS